MVFSSIPFLFFFLPATLLIYFLVPSKLKNLILLLLSLFFYAWGEGIYLVLMLVSIGANYLGGILLETQEAIRRRALLIFMVTFNLLLLGYFKYANFIVLNLGAALSSIGIDPLSLQPVHLPIGISFFTFQALSYIFDVHRGKTPAQKQIIDLALYIALFPQLIAGPIVRYTDIARQLQQRRFELQLFCSGVERFIFGLCKKILLANPLAEIADSIFAIPGAELSPSVAWLGAFCYTLQIYFDFSGYSDMAIGLGRIFGFRFLENFNYPYISRSIREFWRRWHISLSSWLRDYLYIPLGGSRLGQGRTAFNLLLVFALCGFWHGANWTFLVWGLYHGFFVLIERGPFGRLQKSLWRPLGHLLTCLIIIIGWVIFRSETLPEAYAFLLAMAGQDGQDGKTLEFLFSLNGKQKTELIAATLLAMPIYPWLKELQAWLKARLWPKIYGGILITSSCAQFILSLILLYFALISLAAGAYNPFIYFRF